MEPRAEFVHWFFATGILVLGLILVAQTIAGPRGLGDAAAGGSTCGPGSRSASGS